MKISAIDQAIESCNLHLNECNAKGTEIEAFLTRYLLILICAQFEEKIKDILIKRAEKTKDMYLASYVRSSLAHIFRSIKTSEISGLLNRFGVDYKQKFQDNVSGTTEETFYNNIVTNRHLTAHNSGANLTFDELVDYYEKGHTIIDHVEEALI